MLFDEVGRLRPATGERVYSDVDRGYFGLRQPTLDWSVISRRVQRHLAGLPDGLTESSIRDRLLAARARLSADRESATIFQGVHVPFLLPGGSDGDIGSELEAMLVPAACSSFIAEYPGAMAKSLCADSLNQSLQIVQGTRWERVLESRNSGPVIGWYFPLALKGFAIPDQRKLIARLPNDFMLSGPAEVAASLVGCPELLMRKDDQYPNLLALASVEPRDANQAHLFWFFEAYGWNLYFNRRSMIGAVSEYFSGGLTLLA